MGSESQMASREFLLECEHAFAFLIQACGFAGPDSDYSMPGIYTVLFSKGQVGIECTLEDRDDDVSVKIVRMRNKEKPTNYRLDEKGLLVREYLTKLLLQRGIRDLSFPAAEPQPCLSPRRSRYRAALTGYARMIHTYCPNLLAGSADILDAP